MRWLGWDGSLGLGNLHKMVRASALVCRLCSSRPDTLPSPQPTKHRTPPERIQLRKREGKDVARK